MGDKPTPTGVLNYTGAIWSREMRGARRGRKSSVAVLVVLLSVSIWPLLRTRWIERAVAQIRVGDDRQTVLQRAGAPWRDEACGTLFAGEPNGCLHELVYAHPYAPYVPEYWVVYLDSSQHVLSQSHLISP